MLGYHIPPVYPVMPYSIKSVHSSLHPSLGSVLPGSKLYIYPAYQWSSHYSSVGSPTVYQVMLSGNLNHIDSICNGNAPWWAHFGKLMICVLSLTVKNLRVQNIYHHCRAVTCACNRWQVTWLCNLVDWARIMLLLPTNSFKFLN